MKEIILYGAGGHCYATVALIKSLGEYNPVIIYDDSPVGDEILSVPIVKYTEDLALSGNMCITIGDNDIRKRISEKFNMHHPIFIHNSVATYPSVEIGKGTVVLPNVVLDAAATIGNFCIINNNSTVSHNALIGDYCHVAINVAIAGGVTIGEGTLIGAGSVILPEVNVGKWSVIGAGTVITKEVPDYAVVYGNPSKIIRINNP